MEIGRKIKELRDSRKLTVRELGSNIGMSFSHISKIERGENSPSIETLEKLAEFFNIDISYFFIEQKDLDGFTDNEKDLLFERDLSNEALKEKYSFIDNKKIGGQPLSDEEMEYLIEQVKTLRKIMNKNQSS